MVINVGLRVMSKLPHFVTEPPATHGTAQTVFIKTKRMTTLVLDMLAQRQANISNYRFVIFSGIHREVQGIRNPT
eukprot:5738084-Karenia_brevis.AAC.1